MLSRFASSYFFNKFILCPKIISPPSSSTIFTSAVRSQNLGQLDEFFDKPENWGAADVRVGRPWRLEELRLKSNVDLHNLWYVLLKERNMLLTMEEAAKTETELLPSPERIDKVDESMENLQAVIRERNAAYLSLETGVDGEAPKRKTTTILGFHVEENAQEHLEPAFMNPKGKRYEQPYLDDDPQMFQKLWKEKQWWKERGEIDDEKRKSKQHKKIFQY